MDKNLDEIVSFAKRSGFVFPSSEIYDSLAGVYDYGPLGVELLNNLKKSWWRHIVWERSNVYGIDSAIAMDSKVWESSGHTKYFADPIVTCKKTGKVFRVDHLLKGIGIEVDENTSLDEINNLFEKNKKKLSFDECKPENMSNVELSNLLVSSNLGKKEIPVYLRGETAQGIYVNYKNIIDSMHPAVPFGIAQIGKVFRNEISPRQFLFRTREFEQMELQFFVNPSDAKSKFSEILKERKAWLERIGISSRNLRENKHKNLVFYAKDAIDLEYKYPFGWKELEGIHNRGDYDLMEHSKASGLDFTYKDAKTEEEFVPYIVESSIGLGRLFLAILIEAYEVEKLKEDERIVLKLNKEIAPVSLAILPLQRKEDLVESAKKIFRDLHGIVNLKYDEIGSIGKRYRRQDMIGTPYCLTVDYDTLENSTVTIRDRDSMKQKTIKLNQIEEFIKDEFNL